MVNIYIAEENANALFNTEPDNPLLQKIKASKRRKVKVSTGLTLINYQAVDDDEYEEFWEYADSAIIGYGMDKNYDSLTSKGVILQTALDFLDAYRDEPEDNIVEVIEEYE